MSLVGYNLSQNSLLAAIIQAVRPSYSRPTDTALEDLRNLYSLDLYFKELKLAAINTVATEDYSVTGRTLCVQLLNGIKSNSQETAAALRFWTGLMCMRTRVVRFAATKLLTETIEVLVSMAENPTNCLEPLTTVTGTIKQLWERFLFESWRDVNGYQRSMVVRKAADWCLKCPDLFWNRTTCSIFSEGLVDDQDSVRNESMRQVRKLCFAMKSGALDTDPIQLWTGFLKDYAENDQSGGSVNRRTALELVFHFGQARVSRSWCMRVLQQCLTINEPPVTVAYALKLTWNEKEANLIDILLALEQSPETIKLLGASFLHSKPNRAWCELMNAISVQQIQNQQLAFILQVLAGFAKGVQHTHLYELVDELIHHHQIHLKWAPHILLGVQDPRPGSKYFTYVDKLVDLQIEEAGLVIEQWGSKELVNGGYRVIEKPRRNLVPLGLAGLINGNTRHTIVEKARHLVIECGRSYSGDDEDLQLSLKDLIQAVQLSNCSIEEIAIVIKCLTRIYVTLRVSSKEENHQFVKFDGTVLYNALSQLCTPLSSIEEDMLLWIRCLEKLNAIESVNTSVADLFPELDIFNSDLIACGIQL